jgi:colanic acid biosynthesis protein WcaH
VLAYEIIIDIDIDNLPAEQHSQYQWFEQSELMERDDVHQHSKWYFAPQ